MKRLIIVASLLALTACTKPAQEAAMDRSIVGPDMEKAGPFGNFRRITFAAVRAEDTPADSQLMRIELVKGRGEEVATLYNLLSDSKPYLAGVTYHAFVPVIAETNAERQDYWIVGMNLSRTPDRSVYSVIRFTHGANFTPGQTVKVDYLSLDCDDLEIARRPVAYFAPEPPEGADASASAGEDAAPAELPEFKPEAGECEFNSLTEAYRVTAEVLRRYDQIKHFEDVPTPRWLPLVATIE
ncbi:hypothetical protein PQU92_04005 [Asticcacaulis sp. BYS171W]|uniref:Uncharacterized protein n=1 Tax=Asticcacaulis aquaticus TaxID=2984212 RepID=A0ABT5HQV3_9CAUL|nr:hypothetical protein [Asticcacaulis aquaticus]MDC7682424.1 hypothetical protein [Asticcacaulis aquaticus]